MSDIDHYRILTHAFKLLLHQRQLQIYHQNPTNTVHDDASLTDVDINDPDEKKEILSDTSSSIDMDDVDVDVVNITINSKPIDISNQNAVINHHDNYAKDIGADSSSSTDIDGDDDDVVNITINSIPSVSISNKKAVNNIDDYSMISEEIKHKLKSEMLVHGYIKNEIYKIKFSTLLPLDIYQIIFAFYLTPFIRNDPNEMQLPVQEWVSNIVGFPQYYHNFIDNGFDSLDIIISMERRGDLKDIGIELAGHQTKIWSEIRCLKAVQNDTNNFAAPICNASDISKCDIVNRLLSFMLKYEVWNQMLFIQISSMKWEILTDIFDTYNLVEQLDDYHHYNTEHNNQQLSYDKLANISYIKLKFKDILCVKNHTLDDFDDTKQHLTQNIDIAGVQRLEMLKEMHVHFMHQL